MPSSLYIPILLGGMILTVRLINLPNVLLTLVSRGPVIHYGRNGRQVSSKSAANQPSNLPPQDMQCVENCSDPNPRNQVLYEQPVWQTLQMFRAPPLSSLLTSN